MSNYYKDDANYETDLDAAYKVIGLPEWWNDTEESDIKLVALYRAKLIEKLQRQLTAATVEFYDPNSPVQYLL